MPKKQGAETLSQKTRKAAENVGSIHWIGKEQGVKKKKNPKRTKNLTDNVSSRQRPECLHQRREARQRS